ncbi:MAG: hypothetical protein ACFB3T_08510 [Geminicoccaceae bacterium]
MLHPLLDGLASGITYALAACAGCYAFCVARALDAEAHRPAEALFRPLTFVLMVFGGLWLTRTAIAESGLTVPLGSELAQLVGLVPLFGALIVWRWFDLGRRLRALAEDPQMLRDIGLPPSETAKRAVMASIALVFLAALISPIGVAPEWPALAALGATGFCRAWSAAGLALAMGCVGALMVMAGLAAYGSAASYGLAAIVALNLPRAPAGRQLAYG